MYPEKVKGDTDVPGTRMDEDTSRGAESSPIAGSHICLIDHINQPKIKFFKQIRYIVTQNKKEIHKCDTCHEHYTSMTQLEKHQTKQHATYHQDLQLEPGLCQLCKPVLSDPQNLIDHSNSHIGEVNNLHVHCCLCPSFGWDVASLVEHIRSCVVEQVFQCKVCNLKFLYSKKSQTRHVKVHSDCIIKV